MIVQSDKPVVSNAINDTALGLVEDLEKVEPVVPLAQDITEVLAAFSPLKGV